MINNANSRHQQLSTDCLFNSL